VAFADILDRLNARALGRFGVPVLLDGATVQGDFAAPLKGMEVAGMGFSAREPICTVATSDVPANPVGKQLVHDAVSYTVRETRDDGMGLTQLVLQRSA